MKSKGKMKWYHFTVSRIFEDGRCDTCAMPIDGLPEAKDIRKLNNQLYDYPDAMNIWAGFVWAESTQAAEWIVEYAI